MKDVHIEVPEGALILNGLWGPQDAHRRVLERRLEVRIKTRGTRVTVVGEASRLAFAERVLIELIDVVRGGTPLFLEDVERAIRLLDSEKDIHLNDLQDKSVTLKTDRRAIHPKSPNQRAYLEALAKKDLVFAVGPAGTGKTYLAMAAAVAALRQREVERIILTRPAVEAGERLGFLPGSLIEKVSPYLRPVYDALFDLVGIEQAQRLIEGGTVEVAPLAFMRGRTLNEAFIILDEAQNTTRDQMKMFLTRFGNSSRAVVTGDITQVDLGPNQPSGLGHAIHLLKGIDGIEIVRLTSVDVVRHPLVRAIVQAYDRASSNPS